MVPPRCVASGNRSPFANHRLLFTQNTDQNSTIVSSTCSRTSPSHIIVISKRSIPGIVFLGLFIIRRQYGTRIVVVCVLQLAVPETNSLIVVVGIVFLDAGATSIITIVFMALVYVVEDDGVITLAGQARNKCDSTQSPNSSANRLPQAGLALEEEDHTWRRAQRRVVAGDTPCRWPTCRRLPQAPTDGGET